MVDWYRCRGCELVVDEFQEDYNGDLLCGECRKKDEPVSEKPVESKKTLALLSLGDSLANWAFYDRTNDDELNREEMHELLSNGSLSYQEILDQFNSWVKEHYPNLLTTENVGSGP